MIRAASRSALANLGGQIDEMISADAAEKLARVAAELYQVNRLLEQQPRLRRVLGDPSTAPRTRADTAHRLLDGKLSADAVTIVAEVVAARWSSPWDMTDAMAIAGDELLLGSADKTGQLDNVEDQLFRFGRIVRAQDELRTLLDDATVPPDHRAALLTDVLGGKVDPVTAQLIEQGVRDGRKRTVELAIDDLLELTAARRGQSMADVTTAIPLDYYQQTRLTAALSRIYGRAITIRTHLDPTVQGGLVIRVGDEVIDGSVAHRLATVREELTG